MSTVTMPPAASEVKSGSPKTNRPASEAMTVNAENVTVRPAAAALRAAASAGAAPMPRSSRNRLTMSRL